MSRIVPAGSLIRDQIDIYEQAGSFIRTTGAQYTDITLSAFVNNTPLSWGTADGSSTADSSIAAGAVFFNEIPLVPGFYSVRFFPDRTGFWRFVYRVVATGLEIVLEYEVTASTRSNGSGLNATFVKQ